MGTLSFVCDLGSFLWMEILALNIVMYKATKFVLVMDNKLGVIASIR